MTTPATPKLRLAPHRADGRTSSPWPETRLPDAVRREPSTQSFFADDWQAVLLGTFRCSDIGAIAVAGFASYWLRYGSPDLPALAWWQILMGCLISANCLHFARLYDLRSLRRRTRHLVAVAVSWTSGSLAVAAFVLLTGTANPDSRAALVLWTSLGLAALFGLRLFYWAWVRRWSEDGKLVANVAIVGPEGAAESLARGIEDAAKCDRRVLGLFRIGAPPGSAAAFDDIGALLRLARRVRVDEILLAHRSAETEDFGRVLAALTALPVDIKLCFDRDETTGLSASPAAIPALLLCRRPLAGGRIVVKRAMDMVIGGALLLLFGPLMLIVAALIKLDSRGPVIFRQRRSGFNQQPITVYKFRTMYCGSGEDATVPQAQRHDPRVTRLGRFLRRSSLDELPQLLNVLRGDMSLVGPRPHATVHDEKYAALVDGYLSRHRVQAGITGWAQVNGFRGETETVEKMLRRVEHDLFYIEHWSPLFDLRILALTLQRGFHNRNAY